MGKVKESGAYPEQVCMCTQMCQEASREFKLTEATFILIFRGSISVGRALETLRTFSPQLHSKRKAQRQIHLLRVTQHISQWQNMSAYSSKTSTIL